MYMSRARAQQGIMAAVRRRGSQGPQIRARGARLGTLLGIALPALLLIAPGAASAAARTYTASITPVSVQTSHQDTYTVTIHNASLLGSLLGIKTVTITAPSGYSIDAVGTPTPRSWRATVSGNTVTVKSGLLLPGSSMSVPITATAPSVAGGYVWATTSSGAVGPFTRIGGDPLVAVADPIGFAFCPANQSCTSGVLSAPATPDGSFLATDAQVTANAGPQNDALAVALPDPQAGPMLCVKPDGNFGQTVTWETLGRTTTLDYYIYPNSFDYTYDIGDTCFGSTQQFPGSQRNPANNNEWEGTLPYCRSVSDSGTVINPPPCVDFITQIGGESPEVQVQVEAPAGDPKFSG